MTFTGPSDSLSSYASPLNYSGSVPYSILISFVAERWGDLDVCTEFSIEEMRAATNNWAEENVLGEGAFAFVYKGVNAKGQVWAIKRSKVYTNEFEDEVRARRCRVLQQGRGCCV